MSQAPPNLRAIALSGMDGGGIATSLLGQQSAIAGTVATATSVATAGTASTVTTLGLAGNAAMATLASQAAVTLINNKGDITKTLKDMSSSDTLRSMATSALTAGIGAQLGLGSAATDPFNQKLVNAVGSGMTDAFVNAAINGVSLEDALKNSLRNSLVDVFAAETFSGLVKGIDTNEFADNLAHKLVAAGVGCATASAKQQSCDAGAIGAAVGEMLGDYLVDDPNDLTTEQKKEIMDTAKLLAGSVALLTNVDVNTAANTAGIAVENNALKAVVTTVKIAGKLVKIAYKKGGKVSVSDLKKTLKDEGLDIVDNLITLNDGLLNIHDAQAIIDLVVGTSLNQANKGQAASRINDIIKTNKYASVSTGRTQARNLQEKLAMEQVKSNPQGFTPPRVPKMSDAKNNLHHTDGWRKRVQNVNGVEIHYVENINTRQKIDFKFAG